MWLYLNGSAVTEKIIGLGMSALVIEREGYAVKIPQISELEGLSTRESFSSEDSYNELDIRKGRIKTEKAIYRRLGTHPGILECFELDSADDSIKMALMTSDLRHYFSKATPTNELRLSWIKCITETLVHIHHCHILVADIRTENFLLDNNLSVKFADFGESTLFDLDRDMNDPDTDGHSVVTDIGQLGAVIFEIVTGSKCSFDLWRQPEDGLRWPERDTLPSTKGLWLGHIIEACWTQGCLRSAGELLALLDSL